MAEQDTRQNTKFKESVVQSVYVYFDKQVHKKLEKIKQAKKKKKIKSLNFVESNAHRKTNARGSFETYTLFFLAL